MWAQVGRIGLNRRAQSSGYRTNTHCQETQHGNDNPLWFVDEQEKQIKASSGQYEEGKQNQCSQNGARKTLHSAPRGSAVRTTRGFFRFVGSGTDDLFRIEELEVQINFPLTDVLFERFRESLSQFGHRIRGKLGFYVTPHQKRAKRLNSLLRSVVVLHPSHQTVNCLGSHLF